MNSEFFTNAGPLFAEDRLADLPSRPQWDCDDAVVPALATINEAFEKHAEQLDRDATEPQTKFFVVNPVLHALEYVYSIAESVPIQDATKLKVDFTLFASAERFSEVEPMRATTSFFRQAIGLCQAASWGDELSLSDDPEVAAQQPIALMDLFLRSSGVNYGLISNGQRWRLVNRGTSDRFDTYLEVDLPKLIADGSDADFKTFVVLFGMRSTARNIEGTCFLDTLLAE